MRFFGTLILSILLQTTNSWAQKAVLVEEVAPTPVYGTKNSSTTSTRVREESKNGSYIVQKQSLRELFSKGSDYSSLQALRADRRMAVGVETFGRLGMIGFDVELNVGPDDSVTAGLGGGPGYNALSLGGKHLFGGGRFSPYLGFALAHWGSSGQGKINGTTPGFLEDKFLTEREINSGHFAKDFLIPSLGLQMTQLEGPSAGAALFAEVLFLFDASTMDQVPTGALGALYNF